MQETILRIPKGMELNEKLKQTIEMLLMGPIDIVSFSSEPNLLQSYQKRINSLAEAFQFLLEAIEPQKNDPEILAYLEWCQQHYNTILEKNQVIKHYQETLSQYTTLLVQTVCHFWSWESKRAIKLLNKAEQYLLLQKKRPQFATLIPTNQDHLKLMLIVYKPLVPFTPETLAELAQIKTSTALEAPDSALSLSRQSTQSDLSPLEMGPLWEVDSESSRPSSPKPIEWFNCLPLEERKLLHHTLQQINLEDTEAVHLLSSRLRTIPGLANFAQHQLHLLNLDGSLIESFAPRLRSAHLASRDVIGYHESIARLHTQRNLALLQHIASQISRSAPIEHALNSLPYLLLIQTLISPIHLPKIPDEWLLFPDPALDQQLQKAVAKLKAQHHPFFVTNHPFKDVARKVLWTAANAPECLKILNLAQQRLTSLLEIPEDEIDPKDTLTNTLLQLVNEYEKTLNSTWATDDNQRELFLSSLEDLLISYLDGVSYGSCVSGKDRKALQLLHTNAMLIFQYHYKRWPSYTDSGSKRDDFVQIFSHLYHANHYQLFSGQNAPGSDGIKTPEDYLPGDICAALGQTILNQDDRLASNNEINKIVPEKTVSPDDFIALNTAIHLTEHNKESLLELLTQIVARQEYWQSQKQSRLDLPERIKNMTGPTFSSFFKRLSSSVMTPSMPSVITLIATILNNPQQTPVNGAIATKKINDIFQAVFQRARYPMGYRTEITENLYQALETLARAREPNEEFASILQNLNEIDQIASARSTPLEDALTFET